MKFAWRFIRILCSIVTACIAVFFIGALVPLENTYKLLVVESGSMQPTIPVGSLVLVMPQPAYAPGDVVTFTPTNKTGKDNFVTHRIDAFARDTVGLRFVTKGDANKTPDPGGIDYEQIVGKVQLSIPFIGQLLHVVKTPQGFILMVIVPATIVIYEEAKQLYQSFIEALKNLWAKRKRKEEPVVSENKSRLTFHFGLFLVFFGVGFVFMKGTSSFFSDFEIGSGLFAAAAQFPGPSPSGSPQPGGHIVINEVYYKVDSAHGHDTGGTAIEISGNGAGSHNTVIINNQTNCTITQSNNTDVNLNIGASGNSGGNTGGTTQTGNVTNSISVGVQGGINTSTGCGSNPSDEWIELYNPTANEVDLAGWTLTDNSGASVTIPGAQKIGPGKFALISASTATWNFWNEPANTLKIALGSLIGNGLDDTGDHIFLKNSTGIVVDAVGWGSDTAVWNPALAIVAAGASSGRVLPGLDTDLPADWMENAPPNPGT